MRDLWTTIAHGKVWKGEIKNKAKDGSFYWVDSTIVPFFNGDGTIRQYIAIRKEITRRKLAEAALQEREEQNRKIVEKLARRHFHPATKPLRAGQHGGVQAARCKPAG